MTTAAVRGTPSPSGSTPHAVRRVLVIDTDGLADEVRDVLRPQNGAVQVDGMPGYLAALGELSYRSADVVIGPLDSREGMMTSVAAALARIAPETRLLVAVDAEDDSAVDEGLFEGGVSRLELPLDPAEVAQRIGLRPRRTPPERQPESPRVHGEASPLGDVDLVDAILAGQGLEETALQLVGDRARLRDLGIAAEASAVPDGHRHAPIRRLDAVLGHLHAPKQAGDDALSAWAGWLGHWLALDRHVRDLQYQAITDEMTHVSNRRYFDQFLRRILDHATEDRSQVTLMVFDIDDFKTYNDRFGHAAGDEILRETARLMKTVVREHDVVARIGGDEFAVIFWDAEPPRRPNQKPDSRHPQDVLHAAKRFQAAICGHHFPKLLDTAPGTLTISGGLASFPWDGRTPDELLERADAMAMRSKQQGKNAITLGPGAMRRCNATHETA